MTDTAVSSNAVSFPVPPGVPLSPVYTLTVNGQPVDVVTVADVHFAQVAFTGKCEVALSIPPSIGHRNLRYIHAYDMRPKRREVPARAEVNTLHFTLEQPTKLVIRINEFERFFLFADAPEVNPPAPGQPGVVNLADYATDKTGATPQTQAIASAIAAVGQGGTLYVPPGLYLTGTVALKSDMTLYLAGGAVLRSTADIADYPVQPPSPYWSNQSFLWIANASNVRVAGRGMMIGNGAALRSQQHAPTMFFMHTCRHVTVEDVTLIEPAGMCFHMTACEHVTVRNFKGIDNRNVLNADGITVDSSKHVLVEGAFNYCADDAACVKVTTKDAPTVDDVIFRGGVYLTKKSALKIGTETHAEVNHVTFADNDVVESDRGMTCVCEDGGPVRNTTYINNRFELPYPDTRRRLIDFYTWNRTGGGRIENTVIKDCVVDQKWPRPSTLFPASGWIDGVHFENFVVNGVRCRSLRDADLLVDTLPCNDDRRATAGNITFDGGIPVNLAFLDK
ncbi:MAG: hypothetical protein K8T26_17515 [Lentisphaerae bacterium]|nr:hypothetical protein [Lentisphaerota bacterium]